MNSRLIKLAKRRAALVARAESQRAALAQAAEPWRIPLSVADRGVSLARFIGQHKALAVGVLAVAAVLKPKQAFGWMRGRWLRRAWLVWRMARMVLRRSRS